MLMPRMLAMVCALAWLLAPNAVMAGVATADDHQQAVAALADVKAAVAELVQADATYAADPNVYHRAAHRAINALTGTQNEGYVASAGTPGDPAGAIGHIDSLLDRTATRSGPARCKAPRRTPAPRSIICRMPPRPTS